MAKQFDNTNRGVLFKNDDKKTDNHPDYKGRIDVDGTEYYLSAWIRTGKSGEKFMSMSVTPKQERKSSRPQPREDDDISRDIPF